MSIPKEPAAIKFQAEIRDGGATGTIATKFGDQDTVAVALDLNQFRNINVVVKDRGKIAITFTGSCERRALAAMFSTLGRMLGPKLKNQTAKDPGEDVELQREVIDQLRDRWLTYAEPVGTHALAKLLCCKNTRVADAVAKTIKCGRIKQDTHGHRIIGLVYVPELNELRPPPPFALDKRVLP